MYERRLRRKEKKGEGKGSANCFLGYNLFVVVDLETEKHSCSLKMWG
jgi:hypothetical protein